jgi:hypothetical protein
VSRCRSSSLDVERVVECGRQIRPGRGLSPDAGELLSDSAPGLAGMDNHAAQHLSALMLCRRNEVPLGAGFFGDDQEDVAAEPLSDLPKSGLEIGSTDPPVGGKLQAYDLRRSALSEAQHLSR